MSIFGFNQEEILPYTETNASKRNARVTNNMANLREEMDMQKEYEESSNRIQKEMLFEETAKSLVNSSVIERRKRNHTNSVLKEELLKKTLVGYLTETVMKGLVFDKDFYYSQESYLREELTNFFNKSFDEKVLSENSFANSLLMEDFYNHMTKKINKMVDDAENYDIFNENTVSEILSEDDTAQNLSDEIAKIVKEKVLDTLEKEKKISINKDEEKKEMVKAAADSLDSDVDDGNPEEGEETSDLDDEFGDEDEPSDDELEQDELEADNTDEDDESEDIDTESDDDEVEDIDTNDTEASDDDNIEDELDSSTEENKPDSVTINANGISITVSANKSESLDYLNLIGSNKMKERNKKSLFRNLMENVLNSSVKVLTESTEENKKDTINMDFVLAESIVQYTLLETLYTSKLIDPSVTQIENFKKSMNFR